MSGSEGRSLDWSRCAEGFADFVVSNAVTVKKKVEPLKKRKSTESAFSHGNIFEKLAFGSNDQETSSQSIAWSSSEEEKVVPVVKKPRRQVTPRNTVPARRSTRSAHKSQRSTSIPADVEIIDVDAVTEFVPTSQPTQDGTSVKSDDVIGITGFDSDTEVDVSKTCSTDKKNETFDSPVSISVGESQNSTSPVAQTGTGLKASDWLKSLQLKTPSKSEYQGEKVDPAEDSAKKRKKHAKGGLAEQLGRLLTRDKSAVRMWYHQQGKPSPSQDSKSIVLEVTGFDNLYSMWLIKSVLCNEPLTDEAHSTGTDKSGWDHTENSGDQTEEMKLRLESTPPADTKKLDTTPMGDTKLDKRLVLFPAIQFEQLNLQIGSRFKIFPPWQQLELNDGQQILLCTKYCHIIQQPESVTQQISSFIVPMKTAVSAKWNCPCVQGLCRSQTLCPAYQFPAVPGRIQEASAPGKDSNCNLLKSSDKSPTSHLLTISSKPFDRTSDLCRSLQESGISNSLLKSIEACRTAVDGGGDGYSGTVSFSGYVHRAVTVKNANSKIRCHLLVEDKFGSICEIQLLARTLTKAELNVRMCENKTFQFSGLSVHDRFIRDRHESLFTMVDSVWSGTFIVESQDSLESEDVLGKMVVPPGFCYVLQETESTPFSIQHCSSNIFPMKTPFYTHLSEAWKSEAMRRISCVVKVFYVHEKKDSRVLYVTDESLKKLQSYSLIQVSSACDFPVKLSTISERTIIILRDIFLSQGYLHADEYTRISLSSDMLQIDPTLSQEIRKLQNVAIDVTDIHKGVTENDLCIVKGYICEVDEDSAYSWEACTYCDNDQLNEVSSQGTTKCLLCKKFVENPITKMKMEVIICCEKTNIQTRVDLLQRTIENLLPPDEMDEEGYELSSVLNKKIGPLNCVVLTANSDTFQLKEINMLA